MHRRRKTDTSGAPCLPAVPVDDSWARRQRPAGRSRQFRVEPPLTANQIREGRFLRAETSGVIVQANEKGRVVLELPQDVNQLDALIEPAGYARYRAHWGWSSRPNSIPASFTAVLDAAWSVDGLVVDEAGKPITESTNFAADHLQASAGRLASRSCSQRHKRPRQDDGGLIACRPLDRTSSLSFGPDPSFRPVERSLTRSDSGPEREGMPNERIVLRRGLTVTGRVTDEDEQAAGRHRGENAGRRSPFARGP